MLLFAIVALLSTAPVHQGVLSTLSDKGRPMKLYEHCGQSTFQVGDALKPVGMALAWVTYISQVRDRSGQIVGWVYMLDRGTMALQANNNMSKADQSIAGATDNPLGAYAYQRNPWKDLTVGPCMEIPPQ